MARRKRKNTETIGIIGLGKFGMCLAKELVANGKEIVSIDADENKVKEILKYSEFAYITDDLSRQNLLELGFDKCSIIVICIADDVATSVLTTLNCVSLGVPRVIAKASSEEHGNVLTRLGAETIYPEKDSALHLSKAITSNNIIDYISLSDTIEIIEVQLPSSYVGQTILDVDIRRKYGLNIIALERNGRISTKIETDNIFEEEDKLVVIGEKDDITAFLADNSD